MSIPPGEALRHALAEVARQRAEITRLEDQLRARQGELEQARAAIAAARKAKDALLASLSHGIRTPLNGIIGMADLAQETESASERRASLAAVRGAAQELLAVICDLLDDAEAAETGGQAAPPAPPAPPPATPPFGKARRLAILLAEDNPLNQTLAVRLLTGHGHAVEVAENGCLALEAWRRGRHDLIIMDMMMPEMDGLEATRRIREEEALGGGGAARIPIVAMTASALRGDRERCLNAGMDGYVAKPAKPEALFGEIARVLGERVDGPPQPAAARASLAVFDRADALSRIAGDAHLLATLLAMFVADAGGYLGEIDQSLARRDWAHLTRAAHTLKSVLATFSARRGEAAARALEQAARGQDEEACRNHAARTHAEVAAFLAAIAD